MTCLANQIGIEYNLAANSKQASLLADWHRDSRNSALPIQVAREFLSLGARSDRDN
jgi:hypothetical protein